MKTQKPIFTLLSVLSILIFAFGSIPILQHSIDAQVSAGGFQSEGARESTNKAAAFAMIAGVVMCVWIGSVVGAILAAIGLGRREEPRGLGQFALMLNLTIAIFGLLWLHPFMR